MKECVMSCAGLALAAIVACPASAALPSGYVWNEYNGHYYALTLPATSTWTDAEAEAMGLGGHLVTINDEAEENWLHNTFPGHEGTGIWIGFTDATVEGHWVWIGEVMSPGQAWDGGIWQDPDNFANPIQTSYENWGPGEPNNAAGGTEHFGTMDALISGVLSWNDGYDAELRKGIIELPEPATLSLLALGGLVAIRRKR